MICTCGMASVGAQVSYVPIASFDVEQTAALRNPVIAPDFQSIAIAIRTKTGQEVVSINGTPGATFDRILTQSLQWTADGKSLYYAAERSGVQYIVKGNEETAVSGRLRVNAFYRTPTLSANSSASYWIAQQESKSTLYRNGVALPWSFDDIRSIDPFGEDAVVVQSRVSCRFGLRSWPAQKDGPDFDSVSSPRFNSSRQGYLYTGVKGGTIVLLDQDGQEIARSDSQFIFFGMSPNGKRKIVMSSAVTAAAIRARVTITGLPDAEFEGADQTAAQAAFAPDNSRVLYSVAEGERQVVLLDGKRLADWLIVAPGSLRWSPDGTRFAYVAVDDARKSRVVDQSGASTVEENVVPGSLIVSNVGVGYVASAIKNGQAVNKQAVLNGKRSAMKFDEIRRLLPLSNQAVAYVGHKGNAFKLMVGGKALDIDAHQVFDETLRRQSDGSIAVLTRKDKVFRTAVAKPN